jgi:predicted naringenin-chalcone synthase
LEVNNRSNIISLGTAVPKYKYAQSDLAKFMHQRLDKNDERLGRVFRLLYEKTSIDTRYSVLPDFSGNSKNAKLFLNEDKEPKVEQRLAIYKKEAANLGEAAVSSCLKKTKVQASEITHLISVSCTGMSAPGIEIELKKQLKLNADTQTHAVNFVGCYAAFPALKMADAFCKANPKAVVLIVAVELCTLHFQNKASDDHLLSNSLFADGAAAALVTNSIHRNEGLIIDNFASLLIDEGKNDMAWDIYADGFLMKLSSYIPKLVDKGIAQLLSLSGATDQTINHWAIHPGGRKILEACEKELHLSKHDLASSYHTLKNYGNLSAPTILFVLCELMESKKLNPGEVIFSCGFGPGLTMESAIFKVADHA